MGEEKAHTPLRKDKMFAKAIYGAFDAGKEKFWIPIAVDSSGRLIVVES
jgi:hypothetical protein